MWTLYIDSLPPVETNDLRRALVLTGAARKAIYVEAFGQSGVMQIGASRAMRKRWFERFKVAHGITRVETL